MTPRFLEKLRRQTAPASRDEHAALAGALAATGSVIVLLLVPSYHLMDTFLDRTPSELLRTHALWRLPPVLVAIAALAAYRQSRSPAVHRAFLRALAFAVMAMALGMFSADLVHPAGNPPLMVRGTIICTFAVSLVSLSGARELMIIFGLPFLTALAWIVYQSIDLAPLTNQLIDVLMALIIALIISEVFFRIRKQQFELLGELERQATTDALTGLPNRRILDDRLGREIARSRRHGDPLSVVIGDLDHFKRVNDEFGHAAGDEVLHAVGETMQQHLRAEDLAVRWGGEEFLLLLPSTSLDQAVQVADKVRRAIAAVPIDCQDRAVPVTISLGAAQLAAGEEVADLVRRADDAMYRAKKAGRNRVST
ncbi:MAG: diguanylate cyclase [Gammaproteobacteria bacterium]|nr:diguanylate cyclase [Gammaproteobacteria bacterium]